MFIHWTVSIIIPMYNSEDYIEACIESIFSINYPQDKFEVIIVDNGSTDQSLEIVKRYPVKVISCPEGNISKVRNVGATIAKGNIFAFVDSDCAVGNGWLSAAVEILSRPGVVATGSGYKLPQNATWIEKAWLYESKIEERLVKLIPCGNFIVNAVAFNEIGGFNESLITCEDADICERLINKGYQIVNSTRVESVHLRNPKTLPAFFRKEIWYGYSMIATLRNNPLDKTFLFTIAFQLTHILMVFSFIWVPIFAIGLIILMALLNFATLYRIFYSHKYALYIQTLMLYYVYFAARTIGVMKSLIKGGK